MVTEGRFFWHREARLFASRQEIFPSAPQDNAHFRTLPAAPSSRALCALAAALADRAPFCLGDIALPESAACAPGQFLTLTGGSSGQPKVVRRSQASWIASFITNARQFGLGPQDSVAVLGSLSHSLALYGVLEGLFLGLDTHLLDGLTPREQAAQLASSNLRLLYATPTQLRLLLRGAGAQQLDGLRLVLCGGGALDPATRDALRRLCPNAALHEFYGAAETSFITLSTADTPEGSVGRAYPEVELRLLDAQGVPTAGPGEIWVRSPYIFEDYALGDSPETRRQADFVTVGEIGRCDAHGNLWILGRRNRAVNIADELVFPEAIEAIITDRTGAPCAVLPRPDPLRGQHLVAVVEGAEGAALKAELLSCCRRALGPRAVPRQVIFHPGLPLLPSGKVDLAALTQWLETRP